MNCEFLIQDSKTQKIYDASQIVESSIDFTSELQNGASKLSFSYKDNFIFSEGSIVRFKYNGASIFYGYIFKVSTSSKGKVEVTCYDSLRYFKYKDTKILKGYTVDKLVNEIIVDKGLRAGIIRPSYYTLSDRIEDNKTYLDMIYDGISDTLLATGRKYILQDNFGSIDFKEATELRLQLILGDKSMAQDYEYESSIDGETYNKIKLAQDNKETGVRESYVVQDSKSMAQWGILQYYEKVDDKLNSAQIKEKAEKLLNYYNKEEKKLSLPCIGDVRVRGGSGIYLEISRLGLKQWTLVDKVTHSFKGNIHTMEVDLLI